MKGIVMRVLQIDGKVQYEIAMDPEEMDKKKKELKEEYKVALKEYNGLSAEEKKTAKKPVRPTVKKVKETKDLTEAAKCAMEMQKKADAKAAAKE